MCPFRRRQSANKGGSKTFDPLNQRGAAPALAEKADNSPEDRAREMEKQVNKLIEQSADASVKGDYAAALETAKDAVGSTGNEVLRLGHNAHFHDCLFLLFSSLLFSARLFANQGKKERALCKHREANGLVDQINIDLTYAVCFNLANAHHKNKMYDTAIHTYGLLVKNKQYPQSGRLRVNMGNIYYEQKKWPQAIKMYRMALDQVNWSSRACSLEFLACP